MLKKLTAKNFAWIDIDHPIANDIEYVKKNYGIRDVVLNRLIPPMKRSEIEEYSDYFFIILHFPSFDREFRKSQPEELDVVITKDTLITSHNGNLSAHNKFFQICNECAEEKTILLGKGHVHLLYHLLDSLIDAQLPMLDHIAENITKIEEKVFKGQEREMLREIAIVKRDIIDFRRIVKPQHSILETLNRKAYHLFGDKYMKKIERNSQEIIGSNIKIWNTIENHKEMIESIEGTNESLLSYKLNETMKFLTAASVILTPMALFINIWGMSFDSAPLKSSPFGFWIVIGTASVIGVFLTLYFKLKKWM